MLQKALTIVLPMYNRERQLRKAVTDILELNQSAKTMLELVVVDDGSTDETFETACELSRAYPQVTVLRQSVRRGYGAALDLVQHRLSLETFVAHDGISAIDASELKALLKVTPLLGTGAMQASMREAATSGSVGSRRFASIRALHENMEHAHRTVAGFRWVQSQQPIVPRRSVANAGPLYSNNTHRQEEVPAGVNASL